MPKIEMMLVDYGAELGVRPERVFNLDAAVGVGAANKVGDVMLVQAMLQGLHKGGARYYFYNRKTYDQTHLTEPNGRMDHATLTAIRNLQMWLSSKLLAVDGRIDPASFAGRKLKLGAEKKTMLQLINQELSVYSNGRGSPDHTVWIMSMYPQLRSHIRDKTTENKVTTLA
jgi:hypothetical protein